MLTADALLGIAERLASAASSWLWRKRWSHRATERARINAPWPKTS